jgi:hypothetical protein
MTWSRLVILPYFVGDVDYRFIVLVVTAEIMVGEVVASPQRRRILAQREPGLAPLWSGLLFWAVTAPVQGLAAYLYFGTIIATIAVLFSTLFYSVSHALLAYLRVIDVSLHNRAKLIAYTVSTVLFFVLAFIEPVLYPFSVLAMVLVLAHYCGGANLRASRKAARDLWGTGASALQSMARDWMHFGVQAVSASAWQYGNRFVAGAVFSAALLGAFVRNFLIASAVTFLYAAIMVIQERRISVEIDGAGLPGRLREASGVLGQLSLAWLIFTLLMLGAAILALNNSRAVPIDVTWIDLPLLCVFSGLFLLRAGQLTLTPISVALGDVQVVTYASILSLVVQVFAFIWFWDSLTPLLIASIMTLSLGLILAILVGRLVWRMARPDFGRRVA